MGPSGAHERAEPCPDVGRVQWNMSDLGTALQSDRGITHGKGDPRRRGPKASDDGETTRRGRRIQHDEIQTVVLNPQGFTYTGNIDPGRRE